MIIFFTFFRRVEIGLVVNVFLMDFVSEFWRFFLLFLNIGVYSGLCGFINVVRIKWIIVACRVEF